MLKWITESNSELKYELLGLLYITAGLISFISLIGFHAGPVGIFISKMLKYTFGVGAVILPIVAILIGSRYIWSRQPIVYSARFWGLALLYFLLLTIYHHFVIAESKEILPESLVPGGGFIGGITLFSLRKLFGLDGSLIVLIALSISALLLATTWSLAKALLLAKEKAADSLQTAKEAIACTYEQMAEHYEENERSKTVFYNQEKEQTERSAAPPRVNKPVIIPDEPLVTEDADMPNSVPATVTPVAGTQPYMVPPLTLLKKSLKPKQNKSKEVGDNARILEETLASFGISIKIVNTCQGPAVTRYELEPAPGVKVSKIVNLSDDIALKLAAPGVRIEAPIPGKAAIGIEVPNKDVASVHQREVLESEEFQKAPSRLTVALGKDIAGMPIIADLAKMPHLLVAGATGSGKSVCINTLITSILFRAHPSEVKFVLIDPKVVELSNYNGVPHLLTPVVTDAKKAAAALRWAVQEMERRYALFASTGVRDISRYNEVTVDDKLPLIVIIIDELADLMMVAPVDVEDAICRLAQMARAAGLHLVLATQRPSVDVITGTIKANVPSRISFAVSSQVDSRTILDMAGAEKLLGKGDMLFYPVGAAKPLRVQGAFIADNEVEELVTYIKRQAEPEYTEEVTAGCPEAADDKEQDKFEDEMLEEAVRMVLETGQASVSMLQRKFRIGYTRAARLIDTMEELKIVGPNVGSKAREIIMTSDQVYTKYFRQ
ncbi:FtsK/SpoIIIE family DNA translocase [Anaerospora hongkongensis]|uniref:FtsK/SpoIIIE family DNA translocase n=1 Tax=Anaerospora hongkongensis TaxID=244830 RepID=UPI0035E3E10B